MGSILNRASLAIALLVPTLATRALASDGVLEINQACAVQTGCFPGDVPGFPVTITSSASASAFRLTGDLGPLPANMTAIEAVRVGATIDLGGFRIYGPSVCAGVPVTSCTPLATGVGVDAGPNSTVTNGTISGMGAAVHLSYSGRLSKMNAFSNGEGFVLGDESSAEGNLATSNGLAGIQCADNCVVRGNATTGNRGDGIAVGAGAVVSENAVRLNGANGITVTGAGIVSGNSVTSNYIGINAGSGSAIQRNIIQGNGLYGLTMQSDSTYRENTITGNGASVYLGSGGVNMGSNYCAGPQSGGPACP